MLCNASDNVNKGRGGNDVSCAGAVDASENLGLIDKRRRGGQVCRARDGAWRFGCSARAAGRDDQICSEEAEFLGELAVDIEIKIQERRNHSSTADNRDERHGQSAAVTPQ